MTLRTNTLPDLTETCRNDQVSLDAGTLESFYVFDKVINAAWLNPFSKHLWDF